MSGWTGLIHSRHNAERPGGNRADTETEPRHRDVWNGRVVAVPHFAYPVPQRKRYAQ